MFTPSLAVKQDNLLFFCPGLTLGTVFERLGCMQEEKNNDSLKCFVYFHFNKQNTIFFLNTELLILMLNVSTCKF